MALGLVESLAPSDRVQKIFQDLRATPEYMDAHGKFVYEEETYTDHFDSRNILANKIKELLEESHGVD